MNKIVYFNEYKRPQRGTSIRSRIFAIAMLALIIGGDILTTLLIGE